MAPNRMMDFFPGLFGFACFGIVGLALMAFWIWMLIDCAKYEPSEGNDKVVWILIIVLLNWVGALIYYFVRRPTRPPSGF